MNFSPFSTIQKRLHLAVEQWQLHGIRTPQRLYFVYCSALAASSIILAMGAGYALGIGVGGALFLGLSGCLLSPWFAYSGMMEKQKNQSQKLDRILFSIIYRYGLLIQSGHSMRKALILSLEKEEMALSSYAPWKEVKHRLSLGGDFERTLIQVISTFDHEQSKSLVRSCVYGERRHEEEVMNQLKQWMETFKAQEQNADAGRQAAGAVKLMLPALLQFGVLLILLISPIMTGGLRI
jgi:hypothetical protein